MNEISKCQKYEGAFSQTIKNKNIKTVGLPKWTNEDQMLAKAVQKEVLGARAEAGRALQAWSIPAEGTSPEKLKGMEGHFNV